MKHSESIINIIKALIEVQKKLPHPIKNCDNPFHKSKYADLLSVIESSSELLSENGLCITDATYSSYERENIQFCHTEIIPRFENKDKYNNIKITNEQKIETSYAYPALILATTLWHISGEWFRSEYPIIPEKFTPQGFGGAFTYARRYNRSALLGQASDSDTDGHAETGPKGQNKIQTHPNYNSTNNKNKFGVVMELDELDKNNKLLSLADNSKENYKNFINQYSLSSDRCKKFIKINKFGVEHNFVKACVEIFSNKQQEEI